MTDGWRDIKTCPIEGLFEIKFANGETCIGPRPYLGPIDTSIVIDGKGFDAGYIPTHWRPKSDTNDDPGAA